MNTCSIQNTPYEKEYSAFLNKSALYAAWNNNQEQPLDKKKVGDEVIDNPLYTALYEHYEKNQTKEKARKFALMGVAESLLPTFQKEYEANEDGNYEMTQVLDFFKKKRNQALQQEQNKKDAINLPTKRVINLPDGNITKNKKGILFTAVQGEELFQSLTALLGKTGTAQGVYEEIVRQRNILLGRIQSQNFYANDPVQFAHLSLVVDNFDSIMEWYKTQRDAIGIETLSELYGEGESWNTKERSQAERASGLILELLKTIPTYRTPGEGEINPETGDPYKPKDRIEVRGNVFGLPIADSFKSNWKILTEKLTGITTYSGMYARLKEVAQSSPQFNMLLDQLPDPTVKGSAKDLKLRLIANGLKSILSNPKIQSKVLDITVKDGNKIATTVQLKGFGNIRNAVTIYDSQYFQNQPNYTLTDEEGSYLNLDKIVAEFSDLSFLYNYSPEQILGNRVMLNKVVKFFEAIGLGNTSQKEHLLPGNLNELKNFIVKNKGNISAAYAKLKAVHDFNRVAQQEIDNSEVPAEETVAPIKIRKPLEFLQKTDPSILSLGSVLTPSANRILTKLVAAENKSKKNPVGVEGRVKTLKGFLGKKETELKTFTDYFGNYDLSLRPSTYLTAEGKKSYVHSPWFYLTQLTNKLNSVKNYEELISDPAFARFDYRQNPDILGSLWLEKLFGLPRTAEEIEKKSLSEYTKQVAAGSPMEINIFEYGGIEAKNFEGANKMGSATTNLHPSDKILQDFLSMFQRGEIENIRFGDKSSAYTTSLSDPSLLTKLFVPINYGTLKASKEVLDSLEDLPVTPEVLGIFSGYLKSEFQRIKDIVGDPNLKKNNYNRFGKRTHIFSDILSKELQKRISDATTVEEIQALEKEALEELNNNLQEYFVKEGDKLVEALVDALTSPYNNSYGKKTPEARLREAVIYLNRLNFLNPQMLPAEVRKEGEATKITTENLRYLATLFIQNGFINNVEFLKVFVGDASNFNLKKGDYREAFKRMPFTSSPGTPVFWEPFLEDQFEEDYLQDALSQNYTGVSNPFSSEVRTVVFEDVQAFTEDQAAMYKSVYDSGNWDRLAEEELAEFDAYVKGADEADAQGLITLDFYRNYLLSIGRFFPEQEEAYKKQIRFSELEAMRAIVGDNAEALAEIDREQSEITNSVGMGIFPPLKLGHYGPIVESPKMNALHKYSLAPLIPSMVKGKQLEQLMKNMYKVRANYATFGSGSKMSSFGDSIPFYEEIDRDGERLKVPNSKLSDNNITTLHIGNLREQQYQAPKFKGKSTLSTQNIKLVFGDFFEYGQLSSSLSSSTKLKVATLYEKFTTALDDMVQVELIKLDKKLGIVRDSSGSITSLDQLQLARFITEQFEEKEVPQDLKDFIKVNDDGTLKYPLDLFANSGPIEELVLNYINNKVINQKVNGEGYIQTAGTGFETKRFAKPTEQQLEQYGANELQFYKKDPVTGETLPMEVKIGFNSKKHKGLLELDYNGQKVGTLEQLNAILKSSSPIDKAWVKKHLSKLSMVGVRIPVQGANSMEYVVVKEFLPEAVGAIMVLPSQIVTKSGGDYDIDKLTFIETAFDAKGNDLTKAYSVDTYRTELAKQKQYKEDLAKIKLLKETLEQEIAKNPLFAERKAIKDEISKLKKEYEETDLEFKEVLTNGSIEDAASLVKELAIYKATIQEQFNKLNAEEQDPAKRAIATIKVFQEELQKTSEGIRNLDNYKKGVTNNLVTTLKEVMKLPEFYDRLITPNNNNVLTQFVDKELAEQSKISGSALFNPLTSFKIYEQNILSKDALGIDAKINTLQKEFQRAGLTFGNDYLNNYHLPANRTEAGALSLGGQKDANGEYRISKILSEFINGHVDIAKEDWIILLGLNEETSPLAHTMLLVGTPVDIVLGLINAPIIQEIRKLRNVPELQKRLSNKTPNKHEDMLGLIGSVVNNLPEAEATNLKNALLKAYSEIADKRNLNSPADVPASTKLVTAVNLILANPTFRGYLENFDPKAPLEGAEAARRDIAYLAQFAVVVRQQERLRDLTSSIDFNTTNYRTAFEASDLNNKLGELKNDFNPEALQFMFSKSSLAQFNVNTEVNSVMQSLYPLLESSDVHNAVSSYLKKKNMILTEEKQKAIKAFKNNILYVYTVLNATDESGLPLLEKYRGKNGIFASSNPNNIAVRIQRLLESGQMRTNFLLNNLFIDGNSVSREIEFKLKDSETDTNSAEYKKAIVDGLNHPDPAISELFRDIALGAYMQYGGHFRTDSISTIIPFEIYVNLVSDSYKDLTELQKNDSERFKKYLTLVKFATTQVLDIPGTTKFVSRFLVQYYQNILQAKPKLTLEVLKSLAALEDAFTKPRATPSVSETTTPAIAAVEQSQNKFRGEMNYSYGNEKRSDVTADTTFDAILRGERTATTRYASQGKLDYWKNAKVGDMITWKGKDGQTVDVVVTKPLHKLVGSGKTPEIWSKLEGWSIARFNAKVKPKINEAWQIEFALPTTSTNVNQNDIDNLPPINPCNP